jgi:formylglycine-generating enzyme required for sulfatase activity
MGSNLNFSEFKGPNRPVESVSWKDTQEFIKRLNQMEGHNRYRLPSEAEWEYAARAGNSDSIFPFGNDKEQLGEYAWYEANSGYQTQAVGQKEANAWGLYDMLGNVWEWVADRYGENYYRESPIVDPQGSRWNNETYVLRGGSCFYPARFCRAASRIEQKEIARASDFGFRLALTIE